MALFKSPNHKGFVQVVRHRTPKSYNNVTGEPTEYWGRLAAEFGSFGPEYSVVSPETGNTVKKAQIIGGFFDSEAAQIRHGWSDEERESVEEKLREIAESRPDYVREVVAVHVAAPAPWATFDDNEPADILKHAKALGLEPEALRYERERQARPEVMEPLAKAVAALPEGEQRRSFPLMQVPPEDLLPGQPHGVTLGRPPDFTPGGIDRATPGFVEKQSSHTITL